MSLSVQSAGQASPAQTLQSPAAQPASASAGKSVPYGSTPAASVSVSPQAHALASKASGDRDGDGDSK